MEVGEFFRSKRRLRQPSPLQDCGCLSSVESSVLFKPTCSLFIIQLIAIDLMPRVCILTCVYSN